MPIMHFVLCLQPLHENTLSRQKVGKESTLDFRPLPQAGEGSSKTAKSRFLPLFILPETDLNPFLTFDFFLFFHLAHLICAHSAFSFGRPDFLFRKKKKWAWTRRDSNPRPRDVLERACVLANHARYHCATSPSGGSTGFCGPIGPGNKKKPDNPSGLFPSTGSYVPSDEIFTGIENCRELKGKFPPKVGFSQPIGGDLTAGSPTVTLFTFPCKSERLAGPTS